VPAGPRRATLPPVGREAERGVRGDGRWRRWWRPARPDVAGLAWVAAAGVAVLVPALAHGLALGPYDQLARYGLSARPGVVVHYTGPGDQIEMMIPWTVLSWTQVHAGHLPLWNPYGGLGGPLVFNWQSGAFGLPALVGYLVPLRLAYTVAQIVTLLVAGSGAYVFARVLGTGVLGAAVAATAYELSGPFMGWLGWPNASAMSWAGWLFAAAVLIVRGRHRARAVALFALSLALAVYAGQPETVVLFGLALAVFVVVLLALRSRRPEGGAVLRPVVDLALAAVAGGALAAPLALPGLQLASGSVVRAASSYGALPPHDLVHLFFQGFDGLPVAGNTWFGNSIYPETAAYLGVVALGLVVVVLGTRRRRPVVPALAVCALAMAALSYLSPVVSAVVQLTGTRSVAWHRAVQPMDFALALLAGIGADAVVRAGDGPAGAAVRRWAAGAFAGVAVVLGLVWLVGRGQLPSAEAAIRDRSFVWPAVDVVVALAVVGALARGAARRGGHGAGRRRWAGRGAGIVFLVLQTVFLVAAGAPLASSSPGIPAPTPAEAALARRVGTSLVALGSRHCHLPPTLGIHQDMNVVYRVRELAVWDPMVPEATFASLARLTGQPASAVGAPLTLCPAVDSAAVARVYGVGYILTAASAPRPRGTVRAGVVGGEDVYRVPGAAQATLVPVPPSGSLPAVTAPGVPVGVDHAEPARWQVRVTTAAPTVLRLRVSDVPGWHATVNGKPLALVPYAGAMLQARLPMGRDDVVLRYWPPDFTTGIVLAVLALLALVGALGVGRLRRRPLFSAAEQPGGGGPQPVASGPGEA